MSIISSRYKLSLKTNMVEANPGGTGGDAEDFQDIIEGNFL